MRVCDRCGKGIQVGMNVSHSHIRTKKRSFPNLHALKVKTGAITKRLSLCTKCIRIVKKEQAQLRERLSKKVVEKFSSPARNASPARKDSVSGGQSDAGGKTEDKSAAKPEKKPSEKSIEDINIEKDLIAAE